MKRVWANRERCVKRKETVMTIYPSDGGTLTGTPDKDYNILWFTKACLSNVLRLDQYIADAVDANDQELVDFFTKAQHESRKGAEEAKQLLAARIGEAA
jgi:hypothetical protein